MMDSKFLLLLLSTLTLTIAAPSIVNGQSPSSGEPLEAPSTQANPPEVDSSPSAPASTGSTPAAAQSGLDEEQEALVAALKLSSEQRNQFQSIQALLQAQVKSILTPQQIQQVTEQKSAGRVPSLAGLNLSSDQLSQITEAQKLASYRFSLLLTPAQKEAFSKIVQKQRN